MQFLQNLYKGAIIGTANIIPGVSGGTMALMLGIYERLISAIRTISVTTLLAFLHLFKFNRHGWNMFAAEMRRIDALFLLTIGAGAAAAIVLLSNLMSFLLENYHDPTYGFFFGLVAVSAFVPFRLIKKQTFAGILAALIALSGVILISQSMSGEEKLNSAQKEHEIVMEKEKNDPEQRALQVDHSLPHLLALSLIGAAAISAMILPGISGAFLLLLMGAYFELLKAIIYRDFLILAVFAAGCGIGILAFARFLNFLFHRWHNQTVSFLLGLIIGSLWVIWPFKTAAMAGGETIYLSNRFPGVLGRNEIATLATFLVGAAIVTVFIWIEAKKRP